MYYTLCDTYALLMYLYQYDGSGCGEVAGEHLVKLLGETYDLEKLTLEHAGAQSSQFRGPNELKASKRVRRLALPRSL